MLTDAMRAAGWREMPSAQVRKDWEVKGGRWQWVGETGAPQVGLGGLTPSMLRSIATRPVSPLTWDADPRGWGEDLTPTPEQVQSGLNRHWWRIGRNHEWEIRKLESLRPTGELFCDYTPVANIGGEWGGPCNPPVLR